MARLQGTPLGYLQAVEKAVKALNLRPSDADYIEFQEFIAAAEIIRNAGKDRAGAEWKAWFELGAAFQKIRWRVSEKTIRRALSDELFEFFDKVVKGGVSPGAKADAIIAEASKLRGFPKLSRKRLLNVVSEWKSLRGFSRNHYGS